MFFVEGVFKLSEMTDSLKSEAEKIGGDFGLVVIDTGPVFYEGDDENNRTQQGRHAVTLRELITIIPGMPAVVVKLLSREKCGARQSPSCRRWQLPESGRWQSDRCQDRQHHRAAHSREVPRRGVCAYALPD